MVLCDIRQFLLSWGWNFIFIFLSLAVEWREGRRVQPRTVRTECRLLLGLKSCCELGRDNLIFVFTTNQLTQWSEADLLHWIVAQHGLPSYLTPYITHSLFYVRLNVHLL